MVKNHGVNCLFFAFLFFFCFSLSEIVAQQQGNPNPGPTQAELKAAFDQGFSDGHPRGYRNGSREGREEGIRQGEMEGREEGTRRGREEGHEEGYKEGHRAGYSRGESSGANKGGFEKGEREGYDEGFDNGTREGQEVGHREGYSKARREFENDIVTASSPLMSGQKKSSSGFDLGDLSGTAARRPGNQGGHGGGQNMQNPYKKPQLKEQYRKGFQRGYQKGYDKGYDEKYWQHKREEKRRAYDMAYQMAFSQARTYGYQKGFDEGFKQGEEDEYRRQYKKGYNQGLRKGHRDAYDPAYKEAFKQGFNEAVDLYSNNPVLAGEDTILIDANADAIFAPNEAIKLYLRLVNYGKVPTASGIEVKIKAESQDVFISGNGYIERLSAATRQTFDSGLTMRFGQEAPLNKPFNLSAVVSYLGKVVQTLNFQITLQNAFIAEKIDCGKSIFAGKELKIKTAIRNISRKGSENEINLNLASKDPHIKIVQGEVEVGSIEPMSSLSARDNFVVRIDQNTPLFHTARLSLTIKDGSEIVGFERFSIVISRDFEARPDSALLLIVPDVQDRDVLKVMRGMEKLNLKFDFWDISERGLPKNSIVSSYAKRMLAVVTGSKRGQDETLSNLAADFLSKGGSLFFSGQGDEALAANYFRAEVRSTSGQSASGMDFLHGMSFRVQRAQVLKSTAPAEAILEGSSGALGVKIFSNDFEKENKVNYRGVYFSPDISELKEQSSEMALIKSLYWLLDFNGKLDLADALINRNGLVNGDEGVISWNISEINNAVFYEIRDELERTKKSGLFGKYSHPKFDKFKSWVKGSAARKNKFKPCFKLLWEYKDSVDGMFKRGHIKKIIKRLKSEAGF
ncbi:hypothetical protein ACFL35_09165 [Candidatus Riflebacteria bacterium]